MDQLPFSIAATYALWYRRGRRHAWQRIAVGESESELTGRAAELPSGDTIILPQTEDPNRDWPRIAG